MTGRLSKYAALCAVPLALIIAGQSFHYDRVLLWSVSFNLYQGLKLQVYWHRAGHPDPDRPSSFLAIVVQPNQPFLQDYQQERILAFLEPENMRTTEPISSVILSWLSAPDSLPEKAK